MKVSDKIRTGQNGDEFSETGGKIMIDQARVRAEEQYEVAKRSKLSYLRNLLELCEHEIQGHLGPCACQLLHEEAECRRDHRRQKDLVACSRNSDRRGSRWSGEHFLAQLLSQR